MYNHAPKNYDCPFCAIVAGIEKPENPTLQALIVYRDRYLTAWIASTTLPHNRGNVVITTNKHYENLYDLPSSYGTKIQALSRKIALGFKHVYKCDGTTVIQHNEPDGGQSVWRYHVLLFPRYKDDNFDKYAFSPINASSEERIRYARKLKDYLNSFHE
jgi:histidine triad (HIT) family protein